MNEVLPLAETMLRRYGEFYPYGGYMKPDGEIVHLGVEDPDEDHPKSKDLLFVLHDSLAARAAGGECMATAIVSDVLVNLPSKPEKTDAIKICLEHADGYSAEVFFPYEIDDGGHLSYGATFAQEGKRDFF